MMTKDIDRIGNIIINRYKRFLFDSPFISRLTYYWYNDKHDEMLKEVEEYCHKNGCDSCIFNQRTEAHIGGCVFDDY